MKQPVDYINGRPIYEDSPPAYIELLTLYEQIGMRLAVALRSLTELDPGAWMRVVPGGQIAVYYCSPRARQPYEPGLCTRIVLDPETGDRRSITHTLDPRVAA